MVQREEEAKTPREATASRGERRGGDNSSFHVLLHGILSVRAREIDDTVGIAFYEAIRRQYVEEQAVIVSGNVLQDE